MKIVILGSGGWIPTSERETCSALLRWEDKGILIDAGTGISNLMETDLLEGVRDLALVLTHFHLDHIAGLAYIAGIMSQPPLIYAPAEMLDGKSSREIIERIVSPPYHPVEHAHTFAGIRELQEENEICGLRVRARAQERHSTKTAAIRIEDRIVYLTDTAEDPENIAFAKGARVMFHEAWYSSEEGEWDVHSSGRGAGKIARKSEADELYLIHLNPFLPSEEILRDARREFPSAQLAYDGQIIQT